MERELERKEKRRTCGTRKIEPRDEEMRARKVISK